jgi:ABC-type sugar transport system substrate-binding protein
VGKGGKVVELKGHRVAELAQERHEGFVAGLRDWDVQVILDIDCKGSEEDAKREMAAALGIHPRIDAVFAHTDAMARGAYLAAKEVGKGRELRIKFIGIGGQPKMGIQYVKEGVLAMSIEDPTGGAKAVASALRILGGEHVLKDILLGTRVFTEGNVEKGGEPIE